MALVQVLLQITSLLLLDGCCLLDSAAFKINPKECQLRAEVSNSITELCLPLLLAQPSSEGFWCQHRTPGRGLSTTGESAAAASLDPVMDPAQVMFVVPLLPWLWGIFQACRFQCTQVLCDVTELRLWHSLLQMTGKDLWRLMPQLKWRWLLW